MYIVKILWNLSWDIFMWRLIGWGECLKKEEKIYFEFIWILILSGVNGVFYVLKVCLF